MPRRWTKPSKVLFAALAIGAPAFGLDLTEGRSGILPRTDEEQQRIDKVVAPTSDFTRAEPFELRPGGATTVPRRSGEDALSQPSANLPPDDRMTFVLGEALFEKLWVASPSSTRASDGLGPYYNARSCAACHVNDGRGHPPASGDDNAISFVLHLSIDDDAPPLDAISEWISTRPHPVYGRQLQDTAAPGMTAEGKVRVTYEEFDVAFTDGETVALRAPTYAIADPAFGTMSSEVMISPRIAPPMTGLGLIEAIPLEDILANADPDDSDSDGISGRANAAIDVQSGQPVLGRFGWKAAHPSLREQSATAFALDIGISSPLRPDPWGDCTAAQTACRDAHHGDDRERGGFEIDGDAFETVSNYAENLAPPARHDAGDPSVLRGKQVFYDMGCIACHTPKFVTHRFETDAPQSFQLIWPYSDFLLHDMGDGLADNRPEGRATGREWRTPPLWGIGLSEQVAGKAAYLHDGRARSLMEAILWHGGEARPARDRIIALPKPERDALVTFLESL